MKLTTAAKRNKLVRRMIERPATTAVILSLHPTRTLTCYEAIGWTSYTRRVAFTKSIDSGGALRRDNKQQSKATNLRQMISVAAAQKHVQEILAGFPPRVTAAYLAFAETGDAAQFDIAVLGVLHFYLAKKPEVPLDAMPATTRLVEDLGCDSLTMMDTVFMLETIFEIKINDNDLFRLSTLDELRTHIRGLVGTLSASAS